jgi:hypothetical protein
MDFVMTGADKKQGECGDQKLFHGQVSFMAPESWGVFVVLTWDWWAVEESVTASADPLTKDQRG